MTAAFLLGVRVRILWHREKKSDKTESDKKETAHVYNTQFFIINLYFSYLKMTSCASRGYRLSVGNIPSHRVWSEHLQVPSAFGR
jgi:hypothetical protein